MTLEELAEHHRQRLLSVLHDPRVSWPWLQGRALCSGCERCWEYARRCAPGQWHTRWRLSPCCSCLRTTRAPASMCLPLRWHTRWRLSPCCSCLRAHHQSPCLNVPPLALAHPLVSQPLLLLLVRAPPEPLPQRACPRSGTCWRLRPSRAWGRCRPLPSCSSQSRRCAPGPPGCLW